VPRAFASNAPAICLGMREMLHRDDPPTDPNAYLFLSPDWIKAGLPELDPPLEYPPSSGECRPPIKQAARLY
jgi:hypothetical protein